MSAELSDLPVDEHPPGRVPAVNRHFITALKVVAIVILLALIGFLAVMQWRSDAIVSKAVALIESRMDDPIAYENISLEWIRYFPNAAIRLEGLQIGDEKQAFIKEGQLDIVLRLLPLLSEKVIINELRIRNSQVNLTLHEGIWTYDLFKKTTSEKEQASVKAKSAKSWEAVVRRISLENTSIVYNDTKGMEFKLDVSEGTVQGNLGSTQIDSDIEINATLSNLKTTKFTQGQSFPFEMTGGFKYIDSTGYQEFNNWKISHDQIDMELNGQVRRIDNKPWMDIEMKWRNGDPQFLKDVLPAQPIRYWDDYVLSGKTSGYMQMKGGSSGKQSPQVVLAAELKSGSLKLPRDAGHMKNIVLNLHFNNGDAKEKKNAYLTADLHQATYLGHDLKGAFRLENPEKPIVHAKMKGSLPAGIFNLFMDSTAWDFQHGVFDIDQFEIKNLSLNAVSTKTLIHASEGVFNADDVVFIYNGDKIDIRNADVSLSKKGDLKIDATSFTWNKAKGEDIKGEIAFEGDQVKFDLEGKHSGGSVHTEGILTGLGIKPVIEADWIIRSIEMHQLLASFENFDQTFITSENLKGKTDIWTHTIIPYDASGHVMPKSVKVLAAIDIKDGELKSMKTLEDFGKYVHLEDLRHIKFNAFRNYMKIEQGKVYLPVMFLQSSAINMSINGEHTFDQDIHYNLKINAGQAAASKLKKKDPLKRFKPARKSGWINLYFVLSGNVDNVQYEQDQHHVIRSFEASTQMKESLRKYLVDRFGHDVYWLEPNEWEDIPEYK